MSGRHDHEDGYRRRSPSPRHPHSPPTPRDHQSRRHHRDHHSSPSPPRRLNRVLCYNCDKPGHIAQHCPEGGIVCFLCGERGHLKRDCRHELCYRCGAPGHKASNCPKVSVGSTCKRQLMQQLENPSQIKLRQLMSEWFLTKQRLGEDGLWLRSSFSGLLQAEHQRSYPLGGCEPLRSYSAASSPKLFSGAASPTSSHYDIHLCMVFIKRAVFSTKLSSTPRFLFQFYNLSISKMSYGTSTFC